MSDPKSDLPPADAPPPVPIDAELSADDVRLRPLASDGGPGSKIYDIAADADANTAASSSIPKARLVDPQRDRLVQSAGERIERTSAQAVALPSRPVATPVIDIPDDEGPIVRPGLGSAKIWAIVGGVLALSAVGAAAVNAPRNPISTALLALYAVLMFTGLGVLAIAIAAAILNRRSGSMDEAGLAGARMFTAVSAALFVFHLNIQPLNLGKTEELLLAVLAYLAVIVALFRWWGRPLKAVLVLHATLVTFTIAGWQLSAWAWSGDAQGSKPATIQPPNNAARTGTTPIAPQ
jgi:hypothetical protein